MCCVDARLPSALRNPNTKMQDDQGMAFPPEKISPNLSKASAL